jgi:uncharacterized protein (DUF1697 family)
LYVALLRGVNVGGRRPVAMSELRGLLTSLGLRDVNSVLQSGNLVFRGGANGDRAELERRIEREAERALDLRTDVIVRAAADISAIVAGNPFAREAACNPAGLVVMFLKTAPGEGAAAALQAAVAGPESARAGHQHVYIVYPEGIGASRLTNARLERALRVRGTARNWNTVLRLAELTASG